MKPNQFKLTPSNFILRWLRGDDNRIPHERLYPLGFESLGRDAFGNEWIDLAEEFAEKNMALLAKIKPSQKVIKHYVLIDDQATHITGE